MNTVPHWTSYLAALLTPIVAIFGVYIAWRQAGTARKKLKFDLFEKRFAVYDEARELIALITSNTELKEERLIEYRSAVGPAKWLFDDDIAEYLHRKLYADAFLLQMLLDRLDNMPINEDRIEVLRMADQLQEWFAEQQGVLDSMVGKYLELEH